MRAVVVYESMYGNTHAVAQAIGRGFGRLADVTVVSVDRADPGLLDGADILVVGGPTHGHGMSRPGTRKLAIEAAQKPASQVVLDPAAQGAGLREWFDGLTEFRGVAAAFDTRLHGPGFLTGRASRRIARLLRRHGFELIVPAESFFVSKEGHLCGGEEARAEAWGRRLADTAVALTIRRAGAVAA